MREKRSTVSVYIRSSLMEGVREIAYREDESLSGVFDYFLGQVLQALEMGRAEIVLGERENPTRITLKKLVLTRKKRPGPGDPEAGTPIP